jgi:DNA invertase Pin-like site-specific DNA recombinase
MKHAYLRVSTSGQTTDLQRRAVLDAGVHPENIYEDTISGASVGATRPGLAAALAACQSGDTLVVWRIDRLGRSLSDVLTTVEGLLARDVQVQSISDGINPSEPTGRLLLGIFGTLAEYERLLIRERVQAGIEASRARGTRFGRPAPDRREVEAKVRMARRAMNEDGLQAADAARLVGWSRSTLYRHMQSVPA